MIAVGIISAATVALGFGGYFQLLTGVPIAIGAALIIFACTFLNFWGIKESSISNIIFTLIEAAGLLIIIFLASGHLGSVNYMEMPNGLNGVMSAAVLVFFAFIGFESIVNLSEETKNPRKLIPKALIISIFVTAFLYVLVSISAVSLVPWNFLMHSNAPLADVAEAAMPGMSSLLGVIALFATANTVLIISIIASRVSCGMARQGSFPRFLADIHPTRGTPWKVIALIAFIELIFVIFWNIRTIAEVTNLGMFIVFISVNASLIWLRYKHPDIVRPFKVPFNIGWFPVLPVIAILVTLAMFAFFSMDVMLLGLGMIAIGTLIYFLLNRK
jgi:APA family basic amino acid/polyamine antiporter